MNLAVEKIFPTNKKTIGKVEALINSFREKIDLEDEKFYNILIAVTEAVNNAIIHGNQNDPDKSITVKINITEYEISLTVIDNGEGFNPDEIEDPRKPENLLKTNGRGVFLIKSLSHKMTYNKTSYGNELTMLFKLK